MTELFTFVELKDGECKSDIAHFHGAARELFGILCFYARKNKRLVVFAKVPALTRAMKKRFGKDASFSEKECRRLLRIFEVLGIVGPWRLHRIGNRQQMGRELIPHDEWGQANVADGVCDFRWWAQFQKDHARLMGHKTTAARSARVVRFPDASRVASRVAGGVASRVAGGHASSQ